MVKSKFQVFLFPNFEAFQIPVKYDNEFTKCQKHWKNPALYSFLCHLLPQLMSAQNPIFHTLLAHLFPHLNHQTLYRVSHTAIIEVANLQMFWTVRPTADRPWCTIQIFDYTGESPIHPIYMLIYRPASMCILAAPLSLSTTIHKFFARPLQVPHLFYSWCHYHVSNKYLLGDLLPVAFYPWLARSVYFLTWMKVY